jgi:predicted acyltransferase
LAYPFLSNFQSFGIFIVGVIFVLSVYFIIRKNQFGFKLFFAFITMAVLYYLNNFPTLNNLLFDSYFISHRKAFVLDRVAQRMGNVVTDEGLHTLSD